MTLCKYNCIPICDFCKFVIHDEWNEKDIYGETRHIIGELIGCNFSNDKKHQEMAQNNSYCDDFFCFNAD